MLVYLDSVGAAYVATKFFEQYNSDVIIKKTILNNDMWVIDVEIGFITRRERQVRIDAKTGKILDYR